MKTAEKASELDYRTLIEHANEAIFIAQKGMIKLCNQQLSAMLGYPLSHITTEPFADYIYPDDREVVLDRHRRRLAGEKIPGAYEFRAIAADGSAKWLAINATLIEWDGEPATLNFATDVTEHKLAEEKLRFAHQRLRTFIDSNIVGIVIGDSAGSIIEANDYYLRLTGFTREELEQGKVDWRAITPPEWLDTDEKAIGEVRERGASAPHEKEYVRRDGTRVPVLIVDASLPGPGDEIASFVLDMTERKRMEEALRNSELFLDSVFEQSPHAMWVADNQGTLIRLNQACRDLLHVSDDEVVGKYNVLCDTIVQEHGHLPLVKRVFENGEVARFSLEYDSSRLKTVGLREHVNVVLSVTASPVTDVQGKVKNVLVQHTDITERVRAEEALHENERRLATLMSNLPGMAYRCRNDGNWTAEFISYGCREVTGYAPEDLVGNVSRSYADLIVDDHSGRLWNDVQAALAKREPFQIHYQIRTAQGEHRWVWERGRGVFSDDGELLFIEGFISDITELKRAEQTIAEERRRLKDIIEGTNVGTWEYDVKTGISVISNRWAEMIGHTREELTPLDLPRWNDLTHPDDLRASNEVLQQHFEKKRDFYECELRMRHKDGRWVWVLDRGRVHTWSDDGKPLLMSGTHQDITERKKAEQELRESEERYKRLLKSVTDYIYKVQVEDGKPVSTSHGEGCLAVTGYSPEEFEANPYLWFEMIFEDDRAAVQKHVAAVLAGTTVTPHEHRIVHKNGSVRWVKNTPSLSAAVSGTGGSYEGLVSDITERREAQEALKTSEERYRIVTEQTGQMVYDWAVRSGKIRWGGAISEVTGYDEESYQQVDINGWEQMIHPEDRRSAVESLEAAEKSGAPYLCEYRLLRKDNSYVFVEDNGVFLKDNLGETIRMLGTMKDVSERVQARAALEERERFLQGIFDGIQDGISVLSTDLTILRVNKRLDETHAHARPLAGKKCYEVYSNAKVPCESCPALRAIDTKLPHMQQVPCIGPNGEQRWAELHAYPMTDGNGDCFAVVEYARDITERRAAEEKLARSEIKYRTLFESAQDAIFLMKDYLFVDCNSTTCEMFGCKREQILQQSPVRFSPARQPDGAESTKKALEKMNEAMAGRPQFFEWTHIKLDGTCFDAEVSLNGITISGEQHILAIVRDITERKQAQKALETSLSLQRATIESTADGILVVDRVGKVSSFNRKFLEMWRIPEFLTVLKDDERLLKYVVDQLKDPRRFLERVQQLYANPKSQSYDIVEFKDGRVFERHSQPQEVGDEVVGRVWSFRDLTERKRVEMELARLATAVEQAGEAVIITDLDGQIEYVNPAFERITGFRRDEAIGMNIGQHSTRDQEPDLYQELWRVLKGGEIWTGRLRSLRKDGSTFQAECSISPIRDQNNTVVNFVGVHRDVTQEVEMENRLRQSQKLEAVGLLAAGIAHDFNNLLAGIKGFAELLTLDEEAGPKVGNYAEEILKAANRAADLTGQLLAFARKGRFLSILVNVNEIIDEVVAILEHSIDRRIEIKQNYFAEMPFISGDPSQIQSAILNLAINARDAMPEGGRLTFRTENVHLDETYCQLHSLDLGAGDYLAVSLADTGIGMDETVMAHIFDPFFTTKAQGQGTGLGLPGVYGCLRNHHGSVEVTSQLGCGSTFRLLFPVTAEEGKQAVPSERKLKLTGEERLLVVEDEEVVRNLATRILANAGYRVTACADGPEAVALYRDEAAEFDLILLDMMMPNMHGKDVFAAMKRINPHVCVLLMSGYSDSNVQELMDQGVKGLIPKPFRSKQLLQKIRETLDTTISNNEKQSQPQ